MSSDQVEAASATDNIVGSEVVIDEAIQQAKRAYALKNFEQAVEHYAYALELKTKKYGDASPECVDLYFAYGKTLLENAIAQNSVLGKEETSDDVEESKVSDARIHFGEDAALEDDNDTLGKVDREEQTFDLFAEAMKTDSGVQEDDENEGSDDGEEDGEPEDDFNAAWEILEVARSLYEAQKAADNEAKLKLADTYIALGDVSLETEKLEQAVSDYAAAATLKSELLPISSRQIAEIRYKLCIVYDMTPGRLAHAIENAQKTEESVRARLNEITACLQSTSSAAPDPKGKGKTVSPRLGSDTLLEEMTKPQLESEMKDLEGLLEDVSLKIEELKSSPDMVEASAPELVAQELDRDLNGPVASGSRPGQINDLTSMVVKKKKLAQDAVGGKRKAEVDVSGSPEKKSKVDGSAALNSADTS